MFHDKTGSEMGRASPCLVRECHFNLASELIGDIGLMRANPCIYIPATFVYAAGLNL